MRVQGPDARLSHMAHLETLRSQAAPPLSVSQGTLGRYYVSQCSSNKAGAGTLGNQNSAPARALVGRGFVGDTKEVKKKIKTSSYFNRKHFLKIHATVPTLVLSFLFWKVQGKKIMKCFHVSVIEQMLKILNYCLIID